MHRQKIILSDFVHRHCPVGTLIKVNHNESTINPMHHYDANKLGALIDKSYSHRLKGIHEMSDESDINFEYGSYGNWYVNAITAIKETIATIEGIEIQLPVLSISVDWRRLKGID